MAARIEEAVTFTGAVTFGNSSIQFPSASIAASAISDSAADLTAQKVVQQRMAYYSFIGNPATGNYPLAIMSGTATLKYFKLYIGDAPSSGTLTVDLHIADGAGGSFATVLSAALTSTSADTDRTIKTATLSNTAAAVNNVYALVITAGTGAANILCVACYEEPAYA